MSLWPRSVLDEAIKYPPLPGNSPFVLHRHCRQIVDDYWHGKFAGSRYYIDRLQTHELAVQLHILTFGLLLHPGFNCALPPFLRMHLKYNGPPHRRASGGGGGGGGGGGPGQSGSSTTYETIVMWRSFWSLPKVRYMAHAYSYTIFVVCLCVMLFTWQDEQLRLPYALVIPGRQFSGSPLQAEEWIVWILGFTRLLDEAQELGGAYVSNHRKLGELISNHYGFGLKALWNFCDLLILSCLVPSAALRLITRYEWLTGDAPWSPEIIGYLSVINSLLSATAIIATFRGLEWLSYYFRSVGELVTIIARMIIVLAPMALIIGVISIGYGAAFSALLSNGDLPSADASPYFLDHPFFLPWWALLGAFDVADINERLSLERSVLPALLVWSYVFFATVLLLNLLIAQATTAFEQVKSQSEVERRILFAQLVQQYKDRAGLPPPFNVIEIGLRLLFFAVPFLGRLARRARATSCPTPPRAMRASWRRDAQDADPKVPEALHAPLPHAELGRVQGGEPHRGAAPPDDGALRPPRDVAAEGADEGREGRGDAEKGDAEKVEETPAPAPAAAFKHGEPGRDAAN